MRVSLIVATDLDGLIGKDGGLPWRLPADLAHFKRVTMGHPIIMGRKTHDSIGRALPGRANIVLSRTRTNLPEGYVLAGSVDEALSACGSAEEAFVIGGAAVYSAFMDRADRIHLTVVQDRFDGDTKMPEHRREDWVEISRRDRPADEKNPHDLIFLVLEKRDNNTPRNQQP